MTNSRSRGGKLEVKRSTRPRSDHFSARSGRCMAAASGPTGGERRGPFIIASYTRRCASVMLAAVTRGMRGIGFPPFVRGSVWHNGDGDRTGRGAGGGGTRRGAGGRGGAGWRGRGAGACRQRSGGAARSGGARRDAGAASGGRDAGQDAAAGLQPRGDAGAVPDVRAGGELLPGAAAGVRGVRSKRWRRGARGPRVRCDFLRASAGGCGRCAGGGGGSVAAGVLCGEEVASTCCGPLPFWFWVL